MRADEGAFAGMIASNIGLILLVSGIVTAGCIVVFFAPGAAVRIIFGSTISENLTVLVVRHWGLLVFLMGALIVYAAYHPASRVPILVAACVEKAILIALFAIGGVRWTPGMRVIAVVDGLFTVLYVAYLAGL
jgi:hypothetical protein